MSKLEKTSNVPLVAKLNREKLDAIINRIYEGSTASKAIEQEGITARSFYKALEHDFHAAHEYGRALKVSVGKLAEQIIDIADTASDPHKARNQIDARKWYASKIDAKTFGDRLDLNIENRIDIRSVIDEARSRVPVLPDRDLPISVEYKATDLNTQTVLSHDGCKPSTDEKENESNELSKRDPNDWLK